MLVLTPEHVIPWVITRMQIVVETELTSFGWDFGMRGTPASGLTPLPQNTLQAKKQLWKPFN